MLSPAAPQTSSTQPAAMCVPPWLSTTALHWTDHAVRGVPSNIPPERRHRVVNRTPTDEEVGQEFRADLGKARASSDRGACRLAPGE